MPFTEHFGEALKRLRLARGLRQADLEERAHVGAGKVSEWETGASFPRLQSLAAILDSLGYDLRDLARAVDEVSGKDWPAPDADAPPARAESSSVIQDQQAVISELTRIVSDLVQRLPKP